jgi:hypothetical protein
MSRALRSAFAGTVLTVIVIAVGGNALAYFSGAGSGSASAAVTALGAPTITAATPAVGGTVALSWSAVTPPGPGTVTYYVSRDGGNPAGNCPPSSAPKAITSCTDAAVPIGEHSYRVIAAWHNWTATSAAKAAKVTVGEAVKFTIGGNTTTPETGGAVNLTITAKDTNNATVTTYAGTHNLVFAGASSSPEGNAPTVSDSSGTAVNFGTATALSFSSGVATVSGSNNGVLRVYNAGSANVTASEGTVTTPTPLALTVTPAVSRFVLGAATTTPALGASDDLTITAQDAFGNTATSYTGSHNLTFSGASASPAGNTPTVTNSSGTPVAFGSATAIGFSAGVAEASKGAGGKVVLFKASATAIKATEGSIITPTALTLTPPAGAATKLVLTSSTTTPVAGTGFNLTTTAQDAFGNTASSYTGSKNITFSGATASPSGTLPTVVNSSGTAVNFGSATALSFSSGVATVSASKNGFAKLFTAAATSVTASDGTISTASALALTVSTGTASQVALSGTVASAGSISSPCLFTCAVTSLGNSGTVRAKAAITDSWGNVVANVGSAKTVTVTSTGGTISGSPLTIPASGSALSGTEFTYTAPASGGFNHTITLASTGFTSATATAKK